MTRGATSLIRMATAGLLLLAGLLLFAAPSTAYAHDAHNPQAYDDHDGDNRHAAKAAPSAMAQVVMAAADDGGCGSDHGASPACGCCLGPACAMAHLGAVSPAAPPSPLSGASLIFWPSGLIADGVGAPPDLKPPRSVV